MKYRITVLTVVAIIFSAFFGTVSYAADTVHNLEELNMEITTPDGLIVITRDLKATDSAFAQSNLDYEAAMQVLEKDNVYLYSQTEDGSCKITVSMVENEESKNYYNFSTLSNAQKDEIINAFTSQPECTSCYTYELENGQAFFFCPASRYVNSDGSELNVAQYITIINGQRIIIQLAVSGSAYTNEQTAMLKDMVDSIHFTAINKKDFDFNTFLPYIYVIIGILAIVIVVMLLMLFRKKRENLNKAVSEETDFEDFLENTKVFSTEDECQDEPEEPLVIIADASVFDAAYNSGKNSDKNESNGESENGHIDVNTEQEENTVESIKNGKESSSDFSDDAVTAQAPEAHTQMQAQTDDVLLNDTDDFVVAEGSGANGDIYIPSMRQSNAFRGVKPNNSQKTADSEYLSDEPLDFYELDSRDISGTEHNHTHKRTQNNKRKKNSENTFVKIGMCILNVFIGAGFLISYLISLIIIKPDKNKSGDNLRRSKKRSSYRKR